MFALDAERAHEIGIKGLELGLAAPFYAEDASFGQAPVELFGLTFKNPIGLAAGFDKNGVVVDALASLGFGFVEVGTVTYQPQPGNPKPRLFRLPADQAIINRLGFNNDGAVKVAARLEKIKRKCVVGINIGRNKDVGNQEAVQNYLSCFDIVQPVADYIAVNVSSPNTADLRKLQGADELDRLLSALQDRNEQMGRKPLLVKIAPDVSEAETEAIVNVCSRVGIDGLIATNTTIRRDNLKTPDIDRFGSGGLSGKPLRPLTDSVIMTVYQSSEGKLPIIGVGGILTAEDVLKKIRSGASLVQVYTGFVYGGPSFASDLNLKLAILVKDRGEGSLLEALGQDARV
jgi:dihydroorotate dehydrogenase